MALIQCKNCGKEVSDKAIVCPGCGTQLVEEKAIEAENIVKTVICEECGSEMPMELETCTNCGCPLPKTKEPVEDAAQKVEVTAVNLQMKKSTKKYIVTAAIAVIAIVALALLAVSIKNKKAADAYANNVAAYSANLEKASYTMLLSAAKAEEAGNLIKLVWNNSIHEVSDSKTNKYTKTKNGTGWFHSDFNDALGSLFSDKDFKSTVNQIETAQNEAANIMKSLKNPPEEYEDAYDAVKDYYEAYITLTNMVTNPNGSLQTYSSGFNNAVSEFMKCYNALDLYVDN